MRTFIAHALLKNAPWLLLDALVIGLSLLLALAGRSVTADLNVGHAVLWYLLATVVYDFVNQVFHLYHRIWRYASAGEVVVIAASVAISTAALALADLLWPNLHPVPLSVVLMTGFFSFVGFVGVRYRRRVWTGLQWRWQAMFGQLPVSRTRVLIVGAGEVGQLLAWRFLNSEEGKTYELVGFIDDNTSKHDMRIHGVLVRGDRQSIPRVVEDQKVDLIVIAIFNISGAEFRAILDICEKTTAVIKVLPNVFDLIQGVSGLPPIREITAQDLIGRQPVEIDPGACRALLAGKKVMVTGAAGSIGSELCRQVLSFGPRQLLALDNNESGLYDLVMSFDASAHECVAPVIGDVTNKNKMQAVFEQYRPQVIFHAGAYKHVPLMEDHPDEAVRVNVLGTRTVAELAALYGAERFVLVSTDKAVDPSNVMGATKRLCEMLIGDHSLRDNPQTRLTALVGEGSVETLAGYRRHTRLSREGLATQPSGSGTLFTAVRFGNVLGSRGSVVPTFERQIERGGPVTVTHPDMTRYFMSIPEAVSLIIQAATLTGGNDIFMLNMGQQIRIDELARRLIRLRGLRPDIDIPIVYTGPRPGEKMEERLMTDGEERSKTSHPHIFRIRAIDGQNRSLTRSQVDQLIDLANVQQNGEVVALLHEMVG